MTTSTGATNSSRYQFTGRENDAGTGLYYYRARYYSPAWGRFISEDPIGLAGGVNLYQYAAANPLQVTDPLGLQAAPIAQVAPVGLAAAATSATSASAQAFIRAAATIADASQNSDASASGDAASPPSKNSSSAGAAGEGGDQGPRFARGDLRQQVLDKGRQADGTVKCAYCGEPAATQSDHVVPYSKGGPTKIENLEPACPSCNASKGSKDLGTGWTPPKGR